MSKPARRCGARVSFERLYPIFLVALVLPLAGCSSAVSRFDYPVFGYTATDNSPTGAISPEKPVYSQLDSDRYKMSSGSNNSGYSNNNYDTRYRAPVAPVTRYEQPRYQQSQPVQPRYQQSQYAQPRYQRPQPPRVVAVDQPTYTPNYQRKAGADGSVTVQQGDTLYSIARSNNVSVDALRRANNITDSNIKVGQRLAMPGSRTASTGRRAPAYGKTHTVRSGDTIYSIARAYGVRHDEIARVNNLNNPNEIKLGQVLRLPHGAGRVAALNQQAAKPRSTSPSVKKVNVAPARPKPVTKKKVKPKVAALPKPEPRSQGRFRWPVRGRIISKFGPKANGGHNDGINVAVPAGTSIKAVENGVVAYAGNELKGYGNLVLIRHADNWVSAYAHNERLLVKRGDKIKRGQVIAKAGRSGSVSQPQLHFELRRGSKPVNPMKYMAAL